MQKKLLAVAVAGVLAAPGVALAQSSVTISGVFKISFDNIKLDNFRTAGGNSSESRVADDSSRIIFNVTEDLGGGLAAVAQVDFRFQPDSAAALGTTGNTWVGLRSKSWGTLTIGRHDQHYFNTESRLVAKGASLKADPISLIAYAGGGGVAIAGATRTANNIRYTSPNWGGFTMLVGYSTNPLAATEADIGTTIRRGRAWNLNPNFQAANWQLGYSYWTAKSDAGVGGAANNIGTPAAVLGGDQRADRLYGSFGWGAFRAGLAWDKSKIKAVAGGATLSDRTAWSIPVEFTTGNHNILFAYTKARDDKATPGFKDGAKQFSLAYVYDLSKRTSLGLTYAKISNDAFAAYQPFTGTGALGNPASIALPGEDPRLLAATVKHNF